MDNVLRRVCIPCKCIHELLHLVEVDTMSLRKNWSLGGQSDVEICF